MLSRSIKLFFVYMLLLPGTPLHAEVNANIERSYSAPQSINFRDAIKKTFEHNPTLKSFRYKLKAQQGLVLQAGKSASPRFNFNVEDALGTGEFNGTKKMQTTLGISWVIEGKIRQGYLNKAHANTAVLTTEAHIKHLDAASKTAHLYLVCLANQARLINADRNLELANETIIAINQRVAAGKTFAAELARAKADQEKKRLDREDIKYKSSSAIRLLAAQWGETNPGFTRVEGDITRLPIPLSFEILKSRLNRNPDLLRLLSEKRLRHARLKLAQYQGKPAWQFNLGLRHSESTNDQALVAGISIPFGEGARNTGRITAARQILLQSQAKQDELRVRIETTLFVLFQELQHSLNRANAYRNRIIPRLETALKQTRRAYDLGRYSYLEWRSVQAELLNARTSLIDNSSAAHLKIIEIERLTGISTIKPMYEK